MYETFLAIISLLGAVYCFWTKQVLKALGYIVIAGSFFLLIPNLADGIKGNFYQAIAMVLFIFGTILVIYKKKKEFVELPDQTKNKENTLQENKK